MSDWAILSHLKLATAIAIASVGASNARDSELLPGTITAIAPVGARIARDAMTRIAPGYVSGRPQCGRHET